MPRIIETAKATLGNESASTGELSSQGEALQAALHKVSQALYQKEAEADAGAAGPAEGAGPQDEGDVVDAEFTEEK